LCTAVFRTRNALANPARYRARRPDRLSPRSVARRRPPGRCGHGLLPPPGVV